MKKKKRKQVFKKKEGNCDEIHSNNVHRTLADCNSVIIIIRQAVLHNYVHIVIIFFLKNQSSVISLPLLNHKNHVASIRRAAMKARLPIST